MSQLTSRDHTDTINYPLAFLTKVGNILISEMNEEERSFSDNNSITFTLYKHTNSHLSPLIDPWIAQKRAWLRAKETDITSLNRCTFITNYQKWHVGVMTELRVLYVSCETKFILIQTHKRLSKRMGWVWIASSIRDEYISSCPLWWLNENAGGVIRADVYWLEKSLHRLMIRS